MQRSIATIAVQCIDNTGSTLSWVFLLIIYQEAPYQISCFTFNYIAANIVSKAGDADRHGSRQRKYNLHLGNKSLCYLKSLQTGGQHDGHRLHVPDSSGERTNRVNSINNENSLLEINGLYAHQQGFKSR